MQLKKISQRFSVFHGRIRVFFEAGEFLSRGSSLCLLVSGSYCRHRVSSPAIMKERHVSSFLQFPKGQHKLQNDPEKYFGT
jgi:hypothetical protein